ncbi:MAG: cytochrome c3 family protein [Gammaproteobacteria bacterium]|nr:cytochrome c3 family protein [Gammaproteobacteria bacterium]
MSTRPSPRAHIYRLIVILVAALAVIGWGGQALVPDTWDSDNWYRKAALVELAQRPPLHGGNMSCETSSCHDGSDEQHAKRLAELPKGTHYGLACESCHGPLASHVENGRKTADARIMRTGEACLTCHANLLGRDGKVGQFSSEHPIHKAMQVTEAKYCGQCHNPHLPKPRKNQ